MTFLLVCDVNAHKSKLKIANKDATIFFGGYVYPNYF